MKRNYNEPKVQGELFKLFVLFADLQRSKEFKRWSPLSKEVVMLLDEMLRTCKAAIHEGNPTCFELQVWEQRTIGGSFFEIVDTLQSVEEELIDYTTTDENYGLVD